MYININISHRRRNSRTCRRDLSKIVKIHLSVHPFLVFMSCSCRMTSAWMQNDLQLWSHSDDNTFYSNSVVVYSWLNKLKGFPLVRISELTWDTMINKTHSSYFTSAQSWITYKTRECKARWMEIHLFIKQQDCSIISILSCRLWIKHTTQWLYTVCLLWLRKIASCNSLTQHAVISTLH